MDRNSYEGLKYQMDNMKLGRWRGRRGGGGGLRGKG